MTHTHTATHTATPTPTCSHCAPQATEHDEHHHAHHHHEAATAESQPSWLSTYKPILIIFAYILAISLITGANNWTTWMNHFMAGFFLTFSFFKILDLKGFADSYSTYDIIAKKWRAWGYVYAFIELGLGIAYLANVAIVPVTALTFIVMSISIVGVLQSVLNKRKIQCACLGAVFNLPVSTVTIIEDALMIVMSAIMLINFLS